MLTCKGVDLARDFSRRCIASSESSLHSLVHSHGFCDSLQLLPWWLAHGSPQLVGVNRTPSLTDGSRSHPWIACRSPDPHLPCPPHSSPAVWTPDLARWRLLPRWLSNTLKQSVYTTLIPPKYTLTSSRFLPFLVQLKLPAKVETATTFSSFPPLIPAFSHQVLSFLPLQPIWSAEFNWAQLSAWL